MARRSISALAIFLVAASLSAADERRVFKCPSDVRVYAVWPKNLRCEDAQKRPVTLVVRSIMPGRQPLYSNTEATHDFVARLTQAVVSKNFIECHYAIDPHYSAEYGAPDYGQAEPCGGKCPSNTSTALHWPQSVSGTDPFKLEGATERRARPPLSRMFYGCDYSDADGWVPFNAFYTYPYRSADKWCFAASQSEVVCRQGTDPHRP